MNNEFIGSKEELKLVLWSANGEHFKRKDSI